MSLKRHYGLAAALGLVCWSGYACATLGQSQDSVEADRIRMGAVRQSVENNSAVMRAAVSSSYSVQQISLSDDTIVREYVSASGVVFGVAWQGASIPPLRQLLGDDVFTKTQAAYQVARAANPGRGPVSLATSDIVFVSGGHPQAFVGNAYVPRLLPAGVDPSVIR
ncbi:DUF2844 domain-containing protein [Pararobbsia alpina]|jgi:hypothetical protein|uniref:DUF2844 domain-containing protein n=1 Tax=Pararobbsia alpina TaxID=621374 RepID=UPI0039A666ED